MRWLFSFSIFLLSACSSKPLQVDVGADGFVPGAEAIYVIDHGWHTGVVIRAEALFQRLPDLKTRFPNAAYIELGWGDLGFYQAEETTVSLTLRAILWPTQSVLQVVSVPADVAGYFRRNAKAMICADEQALDRLVEFLISSFALDDAGRLLPLGKGLYGDSRFYQAVGDYHLFNTCNTWTSKALRSLGLEMSPAFTAGGIMMELGDFALMQSPNNRQSCIENLGPIKN